MGRKGRPSMWSRAKAWLYLHPNAKAAELALYLGCSRTTSHKFVNRWRKSFADDGDPHPEEPNNVVQLPGPTLSRPRVQDLSGLARTDVARRLAKIHGRIDELLEFSMKDMDPQDQQRNNSALQSAVKAAQMLGDSYPGLTKLVVDSQARDDQAGIRDDLDSANEWLGAG